MGFEIEGKTALVTGANRGIGKAIAASLLGGGVKRLYAAVRNPSSAESLIAEFGDRVVPIELDLTKPETIAAAASTASDVDLVVNNAGVLKTATPFSDDAIDALRFELEANLFGLLHMAREFAPVLKANGGGAFAQLNSVVSLKCFPDFTTYCASKAASYSLTQSLHFILQEQGTQVVSVHPGPIATDMADSAGFTEISEPPSLVADALIASLKAGELHCFPDTMAKQIGGAYESFATNIVEADMSEG